MKIGSRKVVDVCGVCGGDNSTCPQTGDVNGIFAKTQLPPGTEFNNVQSSKVTLIWKYNI